MQQNHVMAPVARVARSRRAGVYRIMLVLLLAAGCSSEDSPRPPADNPDVADPGLVDDDPGATETNFFSIPCAGDADCTTGRVCQLRPDAGASPARSGRCVPEGGG
jgi:hypothetical protein